MRGARALGPAVPLFVASMAVPLCGAALLAATTQHWLPWLGHHAAGPWLFVPVAGACAALALLPTLVTSLAAGFAFGAAGGIALAVAAVAFATLLGHRVLAAVLGDRVVRAIAASPRAAVVHRALVGRGALRTGTLIVLLRLSPVMPFAATNLLLTAAAVPLRTFFFASLLGLVPRAVAFGWIGSTLAEFDARQPVAVQETVLGLAVTLLAVWWIGRAARQALRRELGPAT